MMLGGMIDFIVSSRSEDRRISSREDIPDMSYAAIVWLICLKLRFSSVFCRKNFQSDTIRNSSS